MTALRRFLHPVTSEASGSWPGEDSRTQSGATSLPSPTHGVSLGVCKQVSGQQGPLATLALEVCARGAIWLSYETSRWQDSACDYDLRQHADQQAINHVAFTGFLDPGV